MWVVGGGVEEFFFVRAFLFFVSIYFGESLP